MQNYWNQFVTIVSNINWSAPTWDLVLALFVVIGVFLYGLSLGRNRNLAILISIYMALAVVNFAPYVSTLATQGQFRNLFALNVTAFVGIFAILFFIFSNSALVRAFGQEEGGGLIHSVIFGILHVGLLICVVLSYLPATSLSAFSPVVKTVFVDDLSKFIWITAPIVMMAVFRGRPRE
ncbi:MAG: hypothetical protein V1821_02625 [bacterium]